MRAPSSLCSIDASPSAASASSTSAAESASIGCTGWNGSIANCDRPGAAAVSGGNAQLRRETPANIAARRISRQRDIGRPRHGLGQDALERSLPQLAEQQPDQELLLVAGRAAEQLAQLLNARGGRSGSGCRLDPVERCIDIHKRRASPRRTAARRARREPSGTDADAALTGRAAQERDRDRHLVFRQAGQ